MLELIGNIYFYFLYQPIYNLVILLYDFSPTPKLAWAIIILAILVRILFLVFTLRGFKTDDLLEEITPKIREIENDINLNSKEKRTQITELMKSKGISPMSEIYSIFGQLLFIVILYQIVQSGLHNDTGIIYRFIPHPVFPLETNFLGIDISHTSFLLSLLSSGILFLELVWEYEDKKNIAESSFSGRWYPLLLPIATFILLMLVPATKAIFLIVSVLFSLVIRSLVTLARLNKK